jgi:hypothetical protein
MIAPNSCPVNISGALSLTQSVGGGIPIRLASATCVDNPARIALAMMMSLAVMGASFAYIM